MQALPGHVVATLDHVPVLLLGRRSEVGRHPGDRRLQGLVDELRTADPDMARWWDDHGVTDRTSVDKQIAHPVVGRLAFGIEALVSPHDPEQRLIVYTAQPGSATAAALPVLASWGLESSVRPIP